MPGPPLCARIRVELPASAGQLSSRPLSRIAPLMTLYPRMAEGFCVFCGDAPVEKTTEHVVPRWLIQLTGNPNRTANFGPMWDKSKGEAKLARYSFDQFRFPACHTCNNHAASLEGQAKVVITSMLSESPLSAQDLNILLSWLDKVRIGLWLAGYYITKDISDIEPHMHINSRIDKADRLVLIYRSDSTKKRLNFAGIGSPLFRYLPICFTLLVNGYVLFNISTDFLFSGRIGLPYPVEASWANWPYVAYDMTEGRCRVNLPLIRKPFNTQCTQIYQPMAGRDEMRLTFSELYDGEYARGMFADQAPGIGKVFRSEGRRLEEYPQDKSLAWLPGKTWHLPNLFGMITRQTLNMQLYLLDFMPKYGQLDAERRSITKRQIQLSREYNRLTLRKLDRFYS